MDEYYGKAKVEGCSVEVVWQDRDSSSAKSVTKHHPDEKVYKCGEHVGRAHANSLKEAAKKRSFLLTLRESFRTIFPKS